MNLSFALYVMDDANKDVAVKLCVWNRGDKSKKNCMTMVTIDGDVY